MLETVPLNESLDFAVRNFVFPAQAAHPAKSVKPYLARRINVDSMDYVASRVRGSTKSWVQLSTKESHEDSTPA